MKKFLIFALSAASSSGAARHRDNVLELENTAVIFSMHSDYNWRQVGHHCAIPQIIRLSCDDRGTDDWQTRCHADFIPPSLSIPKYHSVTDRPEP